MTYVYDIEHRTLNGQSQVIKFVNTVRHPEDLRSLTFHIVPVRECKMKSTRSMLVLELMARRFFSHNIHFITSKACLYYIVLYAYWV